MSDRSDAPEAEETEHGITGWRQEAIAGECVLVDLNQDTLPPITVGLYRAFLARREVGVDACLIYQLMTYGYRWQRTDRIWMTNRYIQKVLNMGERRVRVAKSLLSSMGLIATHQQRDERGRVTKTYTKLNLLANPGKSTRAVGALVDDIQAEFTESKRPKSTHAVIQGVDSRTGGPGPQLLEEEIKCLRKTHKLLGVAEEGTGESTATDAPPQPPAKKPTEYSAFVAELVRLHQEKTGGPYKFTGTDGKLIIPLLKTFGAEELTRRLRSFYGEPHWFTKRDGFTVRNLSARINDLAPKVAPRVSTRDCPHCGHPHEAYTGVDCLKCGRPMLKEVAHERT
jgi:hypothetical protein